MQLPIMKRQLAVWVNDSKRKQTDVFSESRNTLNFIDYATGDTAESISGFSPFTFHSSHADRHSGYWQWHTVHENPSIGSVARKISRMLTPEDCTLKPDVAPVTCYTLQRHDPRTHPPFPNHPLPARMGMAATGHHPTPAPPGAKPARPGPSRARLRARRT